MMDRTVVYLFVKLLVSVSSQRVGRNVHQIWHQVSLSIFITGEFKFDSDLQKVSSYELNGQVPLQESMKVDFTLIKVLVG